MAESTTASKYQILIDGGLFALAFVSPDSDPEGHIKASVLPIECTEQNLLFDRFPSNTAHAEAIRLLLKRKNLDVNRCTIQKVS